MLFKITEYVSLSSIYANLDITYIISILLGICVIISKNPIVSVLYLIGLFLMVALYLMQISISFIGLSYLLVYVGAISILFLFILMLINVRVSELTTNNNNGIPLSLVAIVVFSFVFSRLNLADDTKENLFDSINQSINESNNIELVSTINNTLLGDKEFVKDIETVYYSASKEWDTALFEASDISSIGNVLYTTYPMLLLIASIILLLAMIGSIVITMTKTKPYV